MTTEAVESMPLETMPSAARAWSLAPHNVSAVQIALNVRFLETTDDFI
jgi:hypothetical protein